MTRGNTYSFTAAILIFLITLISIQAAWAGEEIGAYYLRRATQPEKTAVWADLLYADEEPAPPWLYTPLDLPFDTAALIPRDYIEELLKKETNKSLIGESIIYIPPLIKENEKGQFFVFLLESFKEIEKEKFENSLVSMEIFPEPKKVPQVSDDTSMRVVSSGKDRDGTKTYVTEVKTRESEDVIRFIATLNFQKPLLIAKNDIAKGELLSSEDVTISYRNHDSLWGHPLDLSDLAVALSANRRIQKGTVITSAFCSKERVIRAGSDILIHLLKGGIHVSLNGRAYESGGLGEVIKVKAKNGTKYLEGEVTAKGEVVIRD